VGRGRLEAFSDGVIAIIITIMVLELKSPHDGSANALIALTPVFLSYALSFLMVAIMWVNHHHLIHVVPRVDAALLWWNNHLLFWMSLVPFSTAFLGDHSSSTLAVGVYAANLSLIALAFVTLRGAVARRDPERIELHLQQRRKNLMTLGLYLSAIPLAHVSVWLSYGVFVLVPALYFMPERGLEPSQPSR
jgi:uncharacterized membrane protein